jgi:hypothetical protein
MKTKILLIVMIYASLCILISCEKESDIKPLINYIKRSNGPIIVGEAVQFAFSIASTDDTSLKGFEVQATFPGKPGTTVDTKSYWTLSNGSTHSMDLVNNITTTGKITSGSIIDEVEWYPGAGSASGYSSKAVTFRYTYIVPEEARGKKLQFDVTYTTKGGMERRYSTIEYGVENMDILKDVVLTDPANGTGKRYFSISEMKSYTFEEVESLNKSAVIDFVYRFNNSSNISTPGGNSIRLNTCITAPSHNVYLNSSYVPTNWTKNSTLIERRKWDDMQLKGNSPNNYVTDLDIQKASFAGNTIGEYNLARDFNLIMQTANGQYRAFVYLKTVGNGTLTIGIKRLKL